MRINALVLTGAALCIATPAFAHHSFAMFNREKAETLTGMVKEYEWTNPHVWIHVSAPDDKGVAREWSFEMQAVAQATSGGWKADTVRPGDKVSVEFHPLKDGSRGGELVAATLSDGRRLGSSATRPAPAK